MPKSKNSLNDLLYDIKRIEEHREVLTEKKIKAVYQSLVKDLNAYLANEYINYADADGRFYISYLDAQNKRAKFLQEIAENVDTISPKIKNEITTLVDEVYKNSYSGMIDALSKAKTPKEFAELSKDLSVQPQVLQQAVNNNISKLTLPTVLEKHRAEIIYQIQQELNIGLMQGDRYEQMAKRISERCNVSYSKAMNITRTETHRNIESGFMDCAENIQSKLDGSDLIYAATWHNMGDERVRPQQRRKGKKGWKTTLSRNGANHIKMEGQTVKVGELFDLGGGVKAKAPSQSGVASHDCNCRCFVEYNLMNIEEFAKATGQTVEQISKKYGIQTTQQKQQAETYDYWLKGVENDIDRQREWENYKSLRITKSEHQQIYDIKNGYVGTANSWLINDNLRNGKYTTNATVKVLDDVIDKNTLPENVLLTRNVSPAYTREVLGIDDWTLNDICNNFNDDIIQENLNKYIGMEVTEKAFVSTSANPEMNVFSNKQVRLEIKAKKGHKAFVTNNYYESEVILGRGTKYVIEKFDIANDTSGFPILKILVNLV